MALWSTRSPSMHSAKITVITNPTSFSGGGGESTEDSQVVPFGVRTISFNSTHGFVLNGVGGWLQAQINFATAMKTSDCMGECEKISSGEHHLIDMLDVQRPSCTAVVCTTTTAHSVPWRSTQRRSGACL
eukprot:SAG11_NODE_7941_length_1079_cov_1.098980_1_plen_129_part_10